MIFLAWFWLTLRSLACTRNSSSCLANTKTLSTSSSRQPPSAWSGDVTLPPGSAGAILAVSDFLGCPAAMMLWFGVTPDLLQGQRRVVGAVVAHRTGHGPFVSYLKRFGKPGLPRCLCGSPRDPRHLLYCPLVGGPRKGLARAAKAGSASALLKAALGHRALEWFPALGKPFLERKRAVD